MSLPSPPCGETHEIGLKCPGNGEAGQNQKVGVGASSPDPTTTESQLAKGLQGQKLPDGDAQWQDNPARRKSWKSHLGRARHAIGRMLEERHAPAAICSARQGLRGEEEERGKWPGGTSLQRQLGHGLPCRPAAAPKLRPHRRAGQLGGASGARGKKGRNAKTVSSGTTTARPVTEPCPRTACSWTTTFSKSVRFLAMTLRPSLVWLTTLQSVRIISTVD